MRHLLSLGCLGLLAQACSPAPTPSSAAHVRFEAGTGPGSAWGSVPFPSDLYVDGDGRFVLGEVPNPRSDEPLFDAFRELVARRGACTTCAVHAHVDGGLDPESLPPSRHPGQAASLDDAVFLTALDEESPEHGVAIPLIVQWDARSSLVSIRPARGHVLRRDTRYAAVWTTDLRGTDGLPLSPSPELARMADAGDHAVLEPALAALERMGVDRGRVAGVAPFTTGDPSRDLAAVRAGVESGDAPSLSVDQVWTGAAIDALLGVPAEDRPGADVPPVGDGTRSVRHDTTAVVVSGRFRAPRFVRGSGVETGPVERDANGLPMAHTMEDVPFLLIVPHGPTDALPVAVVHHGFNSNRTIGFALADTAGHAGMAVLAIDGFQHGARARSATDVRNAMRDLPGPDGFSEANALDVSGRMFGLLGADPGMAFAPDLPLSAFEQLAADALSAVRLIREGDLAPLRAADPLLGDLGFDPDRIAFVGNSMGAVVGTSVLTASPDVGAAVLNVLPGSIVDTLAESGEFRSLTEGALLPAVGVDPDFDEVDRHLALDPTVDLYRWALEPVDPLALAPSLLAPRADGHVPSVLIQLAGHDEVAAPPASEAVVAAAGFPAVGELGFVDASPATLPAETVAWRFEGGMHGMLEVEVQRSIWQEPLVPPLASLDAPEHVVNPIREVHDQIEAFLAAFVETGRGAIE